MHPPPSPAWSNFTLMMECTPESNCCYSVYSVDGTIQRVTSGSTRPEKNVLKKRVKKRKMGQKERERENRIKREEDGEKEREREKKKGIS